MFGLFRPSRADVDRTLEAIRELADGFAISGSGLASQFLADADYDEDRRPGDPPGEEIRRMNLEMLSAAYLIWKARDATGEKGFRRSLSLCSEAFCVLHGDIERSPRRWKGVIVGFFEKWSPIIELEILSELP